MTRKGYLTPADPVCMCCGAEPIPDPDDPTRWRRCVCGMGLWVERHVEEPDDQTEEEVQS